MKHKATFLILTVILACSNLKVLAWGYPKNEPYREWDIANQPNLTAKYERLTEKDVILSQKNIGSQSYSLSDLSADDLKYIFSIPGNRPHIKLKVSTKSVPNSQGKEDRTTSKIEIEAKVYEIKKHPLDNTELIMNIVILGQHFDSSNRMIISRKEIPFIPHHVEIFQSETNYSTRKPSKFISNPINYKYRQYAVIITDSFSNIIAKECSTSSLEDNVAKLLLLGDKAEFDNKYKLAQ